MMNVRRETNAYIFCLSSNAVNGLETLVLNVLFKVNAEGVKPILNAHQEPKHPREIYTPIFLVVKKRRETKKGQREAHHPPGEQLAAS